MLPPAPTLPSRGVQGRSGWVQRPSPARRELCSWLGPGALQVVTLGQAPHVRSGGVGGPYRGLACCTFHPLLFSCPPPALVCSRRQTAHDPEMADPVGHQRPGPRVCCGAAEAAHLAHQHRPEGGQRHPVLPRPRYRPPLLRAGPAGPDHRCVSPALRPAQPPALPHTGLALAFHDGSVHIVHRLSLQSMAVFYSSATPRSADEPAVKRPRASGPAVHFKAMQLSWTSLALVGIDSHGRVSWKLLPGGVGV